MTNSHRKTTARTTATVAALGAFGVGAAIAFPGIAAAQETDPAPAPDTGTLEQLTGEDSSLGGALGTEIAVEAGSLALDFNLDAEAPTPGSVQLGSLGVSPNTGSDLIDGSGDAGDETDATEDTGSASGSLGSDDADDDADDDDAATTDDDADTGSLSGVLAGLSSDADAEDDPTVE